jgi:adenylate cyclase
LYLFENYALDADRRELRRDSELVNLEPQVFDFLEYLIRNRERVVGKDELIASIWGGRIVSESALSTRINAVRSALGDSGAEQRLIKTLPRKGIRFVGSVREEQKLLERTAIAVLPFDNLSGDAEQEYFADGIVDDLIIALSKMSALFVIARNSTFAYKGKSVDIRRVAADLGVRYIVEGSVRKSGNRIRITAQLLDGATGGHVWAERYDRDLKDIFEIQDEVTREIVVALAVALTPHERQYLAHRRSVDLNAYQHYLRGREFVYRHTNTANAQAFAAFQAAVNIDSNFAAAHAILAYCMVVNFINHWGEPESRSIDAAVRISQKAVRLEPSEPRTHFALGVAYLWSKRHNDAIVEEERAIALEPNFADAHAALAQIFCYAGKPEESIERLELAMRLDPHYPSLLLHILGHAHFLLEQYDDSVCALRSRLVRNPDSDMSRVLLAACYGHLGQREQARTEWNEALKINPAYSLDQRRQVLPYQNLADFERIVDGVRGAGLLN